MNLNTTKTKKTPRMRNTKPLLPMENVSKDLMEELQNNLKNVEMIHSKALSGNFRRTELGKRKLPTLADIINDNRAGIPMSEMGVKKLKSGKLKVRETRLVPRSFKNRTWSEEDRKQLYNGLRLFGTDFMMIATLALPNKTHREVYKRFQREDKLMPELVTKALNWNADHKNKISKGFSTMLKDMNIDVENFDPMNPPKMIDDIKREDGIKPLEYYLTSPTFN